MDQDTAAAEAAARKHLMRAGASALPRAPWLHRGQPPAAADLIRYALWHKDSDEDTVLAALALLPAARAEVDQLEAAVLFAARAEGLPWPRIARAMGLASAQAAQQRYGRVSGRADRT
jgi:hypothetical protein